MEKSSKYKNSIAAQQKIRIPYDEQEPGYLSRYSDQTMGWTVKGLNTGRGRDIPLLQIVETDSGAPPALHSMGRAFFSDDKAVGT